MAGVNDLACLAAEGAGGMDDERQFQWPSSPNGAKWQAEFSGNTREFVAIRASHADLMTHFKEAVGDANRTIVSAATAQQ